MSGTSGMSEDFENIENAQSAPMLQNRGARLAVLVVAAQSLLQSPQNLLESEYSHFYAQPDQSET